MMTRFKDSSRVLLSGVSAIAMAAASMAAVDNAYAQQPPLTDTLVVDQDDTTVTVDRDVTPGTPGDPGIRINAQNAPVIINGTVTTNGPFAYGAVAARGNALDATATIKRQW